MDGDSQARHREWPTLTLSLTVGMLAIFAIETVVYRTFGEGAYGVFFVQHPDFWYWPLVWTPFTNLVSHQVGNLLHLANLVFLLPLGLWAERQFSKARILAAYFLLGAVSSTVQVLATKEPVNGSSAGITVLAGAWFLATQIDQEWGSWWLIPWAVPVTLVIPVAFPEIGRVLVPGFEGIGHWSHLAGFLLGVVAYPIILRPSSAEVEGDGLG